MGDPAFFPQSTDDIGDFVGSPTTIGGFDVIAIEWMLLPLLDFATADRPRERSQEDGEDCERNGSGFDLGKNHYQSFVVNFRVSRRNNICSNW